MAVPNFAFQFLAYDRVGIELGITKWFNRRFDIKIKMNRLKFACISSAINWQGFTRTVRITDTEFAEILNFA